MEMNSEIVPYKGIEGIDLYLPIDVVRQSLSNEGLRFREEVWGGNSETIPNPWTILIVDDVVSLFFASNSKLFKIVLWKNYQGSLPNGIHPRMAMTEAQCLDPALVYDDWNEDYESPLGYWLEDDPDTEEVSSISIFIREILDEDNFDYCNW